MAGTHIVFVVFFANVVYATGLIIYRLYFHPFAKYPGPFLAKISYLYAFYHAWIEDTTIAQLQCHRKYGHVVRYNPDALMFDEPAAMKEIYGHGKNFWKGKAYAPTNADPHGRPNIAFNLNKDDHAKRRRIIIQAFSDRALRDSQVYALQHIDVLCKKFAELPLEKSGKWSQPTDIEKLIYWCFQDIINDLVFGRSYNMLNNPESRKKGETILNSMFRMQLCFQYPALFKPGANKWLDFGTWFLPDVVSAINAFLLEGATAAMARINSPPKDSAERKDVLSYLINSRDPETGAGIDQGDIVTEACLLQIAGATTLASIMSSVLWHLTRDVNKHAYSALAFELRNKFASVEDIQLGTELKHCTYLYATLLESFRLVGSTAFWRDAGVGGATITIPDGAADEHIPSAKNTSSTTHYIPAGMTAGSCEWATGRDPNVHPDPDTFDPARFISNSTFYTSRGFSASDAEKVSDRSRRAVKLFAVGPRSCIAENLAWSLMELELARIVFQFDMKQPEGEFGEIGGGSVKKYGHGSGRENKHDYQWWGSFTTKGVGPTVQLRKAA